MSKPKRCKHCGKQYTSARGMQVVCSPLCGIALARRKAQEKADKLARAKTKEAKERIKRDADWRRETQEIFNKMRRLEELLWFKVRGMEPYCISCQLPIGNDQWCCGHFKTRKARPDLAFDRINTYLQHNVRCNQFLSADIEGYKRGLAIRFGEEEARRILEYCEPVKPDIKRTPEDWKAMKREFRQRIRELEKQLSDD